MKAEAVWRMTTLGIIGNAIKEFKKTGRLNYSERVQIGKTQAGIVYWLDEAMMKMVGDWQEESGNLVYHVIHTKTSVGELLDCLYVSKFPEEWKLDRADITNFGQMVSHTINMTAPELSESGYIGVMPACGGLIRTW